MANHEDRRDFLEKVASAVFAGMVLGGAKVEAQRPDSGVEPTPPPPFKIGAEAQEDVLLRMQRDLQRALTKPIDQRRWGMVIDTRKCVGCHACTVGCVMENKLPPGVVYRPVIDMEVGEYPNVDRRFLPRPCMQCDKPPCVPVCPVGATWKRKDGIVEIDYDACIGCRYCITACPYSARTFDFGENWTDAAAAGKDGPLALETGRIYEELPNFEYGETWERGEGIIPQSPVGNARKCTFCIHRVEKGVLPMCATTCIGRATFFGDFNDPESLVSELIARNNAVRLKEELGTEPKVYYLV
ncbi:phenylacetyl-CoA:acceptor oxidoreductase PadC subunit [Oceanithermus profundus DSM 14977]|uniref:Phenylacetyl-CoA:acceptor oxidoreductase PadC subunit n=1 Tax=Oceanithermus profundus (strain DSM 14977 / NBRC 100410 / VKM B-2274 / 506) TaxID=670487 RepID=E4U6U6_OCEP5|nr:4Fe-4S dicluster domain-containing protein [Oceanithermus profundus]ADR35890.1 phenylacetyl-CoA:acceptor oxidoreductase PadC subunit [Oceanithermus profundus DSM 14977]